MKKFYSLMLAATAAIAATAAPQANREFTFSEKTIPAANILQTEDFALSSPLRAASTMAAPAGAPQSLEGKSAIINFSIIEADESGNDVVYPFSNTVTFSNEQVEEGMYVYTMTSFLKGIYNANVTVYDITAAYNPENGAFYLFGSDDMIKFPLNNGTTATCSMWAANSTGNCVQPGAYEFSYDNGVFSIVNPFTVKYSNGTSQTFTASSFLLGCVNGDRLSYYVELGADFTMEVLDGSGDMNWVMTNQQGPQNKNATVGATINGDVLTVKNFAGMFDVPMTIDAAAKTLTANKVQVTAITDYKAYLSEQAADKSNAAGTGKYILTSTYSVADGTTTVAVPNWNAFFNQFGVGESSYFWPMTDTTIVFDFDLDALAEAGVEGIAADAVDANAPVEYFNLQGIRVANPEAGQLLIKRQGNQTSKVVIR